jgi:hypothetical protein
VGAVLVGRLGIPLVAAFTALHAMD